MRWQLPRSTQNWITLIGATIAIISLFMIIFLFVVSTFWVSNHTYLGLVIYIMLPAVMIMGLLLIPLGMFVQMNREKKHKAVIRPPWPRIDLNDSVHRNAFFIFTIGTTILLFLSAIGSYEAFHFTESVSFCGETCHSVMNPEFVAYQNSPHARVACVECHVGSGADWYVRSKMSGTYQVYAVLANVYPKPIPTPIENLRPARETCEQCHWPQKFYSFKIRHETHYLSDENNTQWDIDLVMKIGAKKSALGLQEGIHWHINPDIKIEYIASDKTREKLPWVRYTNQKTGETIVYNDQDEPLDEDQIVNGEMRTMECIDCHNRPSHNYRPPTLFINEAMTAGAIPKELPNIKSVAIDLSAEEYSTMDSAMMSIEKEIHKYYRENYPDIYESKTELIGMAVTGLQEAFSKNIFPEMKVKWSAYPNHIGHLEFNGCFRCHNDTHTSEKGDTIRKDCNLCHVINAQGSAENMEIGRVGDALEFKHPENIDEAWKEMLCIDCHTGLNP